MRRPDASMHFSAVPRRERGNRRPEQRGQERMLSAADLRRLSWLEIEHFSLLHRFCGCDDHVCGSPCAGAWYLARRSWPRIKDGGLSGGRDSKKGGIVVSHHG